MPNRAIKDERDSGRPKVGPADPATVSRELRKRLAEREPAPPKHETKPKPKPKMPDQNTGDLSVWSVGRKLRARKMRMDDAIDEASR